MKPDLSDRTVVLESLRCLPDARGDAIEVAALSGLPLDRVVAALRGLRDAQAVLPLPVKPAHQRWVVRGDV